MATDEEILDILLQIRAQGLAEADAVNAIVGKTGSTAAAVAGQVGGLTLASERAAGSFKNYETNLKNAVIVSGEAGSITDGLARKMNALGQLGIAPASLAMLGGVLAIGGLVTAGKSAIEIADANEKADKSLGQAYKQLGEAVPTKTIDTFIEKNKAFIPSIADVKEGFATVARAGMDNTMQQRLMNDALDLSRAHNIDLASAINTLLMAESGRATGLLQLGINVREITDPQKELTKAIKEQSIAQEEKRMADRRYQEELVRLHDKRSQTQNDLMALEDLARKDQLATNKLTDANQNLAVAQQLVNEKGDRFKSILDQVEPKIVGARANLSKLSQDVSTLNTDWQKLANDAGPALISALDSSVNFIDTKLIPAAHALEVIVDQTFHALPPAINTIGQDLNNALGTDARQHTAPPQSGSRVQWDPYTKTWTWAVGPSGTIAQHPPGEYVDPVTGKIYSVSNPQEQSGPAAPRPQDFGLTVDQRGRIMHTPRGGDDTQLQAYNLAERHYQETMQARKEAQDAYRQMLQQLGQIVTNTRGPGKVVVNQYITGSEVAPQLANSYSRAIRRLTGS